MTEAEFHTVIAHLTQAERDGDVAALDALTTSDFTLVGPLGFVLQKDEWLDRYRSGALTTEVCNWQPDTVRRHNDAVILIGTQHQRTRYQGQPVDAQLRTTHVLVHLEGQWRVIGTHMSPLGQPPAFARPTQPISRPSSAPPTA